LKAEELPTVDDAALTSATTARRTIVPPLSQSATPTDDQTTVPVTADNFVRAESDTYFAVPVKQTGGLGSFYHYREPMALDNQSVIRANRDTLYSTALVDLDAGPVTVTLPDAGKRFMSLLVINEDHYAIDSGYAPGTFTYDKDTIGTRYAMLALRTFVDPDDPHDLPTVHALQDAATIAQPGGPGSFDLPRWDPVSQKSVRDALLVLNTTLPDLRHAFGRKDDFDPVRHLIGTAAGWGGNPDKDAVFLNVTPAQNDGTTTYRLTVPADVPVDGFWSITVYQADGYLEQNPQGGNSLNNASAQKSADGTVTVQFGGCDGQSANCLSITPGWNYTVRLYRPRQEVLDGSWTFPDPLPAQTG
jgi:hypothetical protein